jgi:putative ABC transport system substrate-binding protein
MFAPELDGKRQEILIEAVSSLRTIAVMGDPTMSQTTPQHLQELREAARARGVEVSIFSITKTDEIAPAIERAKAAGAEALNFLATPLFIANRHVVVERVAAVGLPAIYQWPEMAQDGGLMAYGARTTQIYSQVARLAAKVLRGVKPTDLPVEQPTKFELIVNLKTARTLGLAVSPTLLARADEVIE